MSHTPHTPHTAATIGTLSDIRVARLLATHAATPAGRREVIVFLWTLVGFDDTDLPEDRDDQIDMITESLEGQRCTPLDAIIAYILNS